MNEYKVKQLRKMLQYETDTNETHYGAYLSHWAGDAKPINIDAGAIEVLIEYYSNKKEEDEN